MTDLDTTLFLWLNAPAHPAAATLGVAVFLAKYLVVSLPLGWIIGWFRGSTHTRRTLLFVAVAAAGAIAMSGLIGHIAPQPRPFVLGLGHRLIEHEADASFPSDHLTLWWTVAVALWARGATRIGLTLGLLGLTMAWARIYVGVHFPIDMVGAMGVAALAVSAARLTQRVWLGGLTRRIIAVQRRLLPGH
ncbi:MAG: undecaprenyl-diphosphatase [Burkholderiales bacterium]|nr:undecaprenyl-diphosphatase [Burkholderiales bacterium]